MNLKTYSAFRIKLKPVFCSTILLRLSEYCKKQGYNQNVWWFYVIVLSLHTIIQCFSFNNTN